MGGIIRRRRKPPSYHSSSKNCASNSSVIGTPAPSTTSAHIPQTNAPNPLLDHPIDPVVSDAVPRQFRETKSLHQDSGCQCDDDGEFCTMVFSTRGIGERVS